MKSGSLLVVGTGFLVAGQVTPEAQAAMRAADRLFFLVAEPATRLWLESLHTAAESLHDVFWEGRPRQAACIPPMRPCGGRVPRDSRRRNSRLAPAPHPGAKDVL